MHICIMMYRYECMLRCGQSQGVVCEGGDTVRRALALYVCMYVCMYVYAWDVLICGQYMFEYILICGQSQGVVCEGGDTVRGALALYACIS